MSIDIVGAASPWRAATLRVLASADYARVARYLRGLQDVWDDPRRPPAQRAAARRDLVRVREHLARLRPRPSDEHHLVLTRAELEVLVTGLDAIPRHDDRAPLALHIGERLVSEIDEPGSWRAS